MNNGQTPHPPAVGHKEASIRSVKGRHVKRRRRSRRLWIVSALLVLCCALGIAAVGGILRDRDRQDEFESLSQAVHIPESLETEPVSTIPADKPPEEEKEPEILPQYLALHGQNPDPFGWVSIEDTVLDYPVMYTPEEPEKYLRLSFTGEASTAGTPFMDANCALDSDNYIIYGHNMKNGTMFREILQYADKSYWQEHPVIRFDTLYEQGEYEVLAAFYDRVYYSYEDCFKFYRFIKAADEADYDGAIRNYKEKSLYDTGVTAEYGDKLITLVTCAYHTENGRFVVVARKR